ncbi:MAG: hypothetical protein QXO65_03460, partial [Candidatus Aenigmatarchaeota archaeon]
EYIDKNKDILSKNIKKYDDKVENFKANETKYNEYMNELKNLSNKYFELEKIIKETNSKAYIEINIYKNTDTKIKDTINSNYYEKILNLINLFSNKINNYKDIISDSKIKYFKALKNIINGEYYEENK